MTNPKQLDDIADLVDGEPPAATPLTPDVRSGATFPFLQTGSSDDPYAPFLVIWIYTVKLNDRREFADAVANFEDSLPTPPIFKANHLGYRGTYSVSISSASPTFEYRSIWTLGSLADLQVLNDELANTGSDPLSMKLQAMLKLIDRDTPMRAEVVGRTKFARILSK
jgi:hypothetical protein